MNIHLTSIVKNRRCFLKVLFFISVLLVLSGCELFDEDNSEVPEKKYLVSKELLMPCPISLAKQVVGIIEENYDQAAGLGLHVKNGYSVYRIEYNTSCMDQDIVAAGLVCIPIADGTFPLLSFQNGTNTLHAAAPSAAYTDSLYIFIEAMSSFGFIVALPDYPGFGTSKNIYHPYLLKEPTVQTIIDMYRAIKEMMEDNPSAGILKDTYLMGYSQGGWATMALKKEMETSLSAEFTLKASACGAGPYDLNLISKNILEQETYPMPYFMAYVIHSYIRAGEIDITWSDIFKPAFSGDNYIPDLFDGTKSEDYINSKLSTKISDLFTDDLVSNFTTGGKYASLRAALTNNSVAAWKTASPVLLIHGLGDTFVTPAVSENLYNDFLAKGTAADSVTYLPIPGLDHREAVIPWGLTSIKWILETRE